MENIKLLDCTLRDGGYVNDWDFGNDNIVNIFNRLVSAKMDIIEVGFLDERRELDYNRSIMPGSGAVNAIYGDLEKGESLIVGMIDFGTCVVEHILPAKDCFLDGIRVIFKKPKMQDAIAFCGQLKELGYKVFVQAVSITSYNDEELAQLISLVNDLEPYAFSLVDTYGLLHKKDLQHIYEIADATLKKQIGLGYHAHNNFQLAYSNCIEFVEHVSENNERMVLVDGSLYGMGKSAGNAPIELLAMFLNENFDKKYHIHHLLEAIDVNILDIYQRMPWGYNFKFYLAALNDCHPNYVSYFMEKRKLSVKSINEILSSLSPEKRLNFDQAYLEELYLLYQKQECDDQKDKQKLKEILNGKAVLLLGPGNSVLSDEEKIKRVIGELSPYVISVNFLPEQYEQQIDAVFMSNAKRYVQMSARLLKTDDLLTLATSNITRAKGNFHYLFNYSSLLDEEAMIVDNPMIMLIRLLDELGVKNIYLAGFDGYTKSEKADYVNPNMAHTFSKSKATEINEDVIASLARFARPSQMQFVTESLYVQV